jgi:hypothetical protein
MNTEKIGHVLVGVGSTIAASSCATNPTISLIGLGVNVVGYILSHYFGRSMAK